MISIDPQRIGAVNAVRHEFGHMVAAKICGFGTGEVTCGQHQAGAAINLAPFLPDITAVKSYITKRLTVLWSGVLAEALSSDKIDNSRAHKLLKSTASDDFSKAREHLKTLTGVSVQAACTAEAFQGELDRINEETWIIASKMVVDNRELIIGLTTYFMTEWDSAVALDKKNSSEFTLSADRIDAQPGVSELGATFIDYFPSFE